MKNNIDIYFKDIRKDHPFTFEEEISLATRIQAGDKEALDTLVKGNLRFVVTEARKHLGRGLVLEDLIQEGNIGLIEAAKRFDPEAGFRFVTYAIYWIRQAIFAAISLNRSIRLPMNVVTVVSQLNRAVDTFKTVEGRDPSDVELAKMIRMPLDMVQLILQSSTLPVSLDKEISSGDDESCKLVDMIADEQSPATDSTLEEESLTVDLLSTIYSSLTNREATIVAKLYGIGCKAMTEDQVADTLGISVQRLHQLREKAIKKLKQNNSAIGTLIKYLG